MCSTYQVHYKDTKKVKSPVVNLIIFHDIAVLFLPRYAHTPPKNPEYLCIGHDSHNIRQVVINIVSYLNMAFSSSDNRGIASVSENVTKTNHQCWKLIYWIQQSWRRRYEIKGWATDLQYHKRPGKPLS